MQLHILWRTRSFNLSRDVKISNVVLGLRHSDRCIQSLADVKDVRLDAGLGLRVDQTETIFTNPSDPRTEDYVTGRFG